METEISEENEKQRSPFDSDWEKRILCSDGNCIGVIGSNGHCKECGKKYEGTLPEDHFLQKDAPSPADNSLEEEHPSDEEDISHNTAGLNEMDESPADNDWEKRILCSDGNCIGVIGPDGKCKECGKPVE